MTAQQQRPAPPPDRVEQTAVLAPLCWLIRTASGTRGRLLAAAALGALAAGSAVGLIATSAWLIARAAQQPPVLFLMVAVVSVRTFGIGRGVLRYAERLVSHDAALRRLALLREQLVRQLAAIAPAGLRVWRRGDLLSRLVSDVDDAGDAFLRGLLPLGVAAVVGGGTVLLAWLILPAAGVGLAVALLLACVAAPSISARGSARTERELVALRGERSRLTGEMLDDLVDLRLSGLLPARLDELAELESNGRRRAAGSARSAGIASGIAVLSMGFAVLIAVWFGVPAVAGNGLNPVLLAVIVMTPLALTETVQSVGTAVGTLRRSAAAAVRLKMVLDTRPVVEPPAPGSTEPLPQRQSGPDVRVRGVSARWPGAADDAISGIDLDLTPGRRIVVLGASGAGKSTLIAVLLGFIPTTAGRITVAGVDISRLEPDEARTMFSWCDQQAHLFDTTLAENIRLADPGACDEQIAEALRRAGAGPWLKSLPDGLATLVGEPGQAVSGGQRQRIALARALLADRPILLADEPAAHLDGPTADAVTAAILQPDPNRCVVLVTHREQDAVDGDLVIRLDAGRLLR